MTDQQTIVDKNLAKVSPNQRTLEAATVLSLMTPRKEIYQVKDSDNLLKAFHKLKAHNLLALPVYTPEANRFFGFLDVSDLLKFILQLTSNYDKKRETSWTKFLETEDSFNSATCGSVANLSHHNNFTQVDPRANVSSAIAITTSSFGSLHRFAVVGPYPKYELLGIVSQSDVLRWIDSQLDKSDPLFQKSIKELKVGAKLVRSVQEGDKVSVALETLKKYNVPAVAVLDKEGRLIGNFSMSEVRSLSSIDVDSLLEFTNKTCGEVVASVKAATDSSSYPVVVKPETTVEQAIRSILDAKIHRAYLVAEDGKPVGVVSISDLLRLFVY